MADKWNLTGSAVVCEWIQKEGANFVHSCVCPKGPYVQTGRGVR